MALDINNYEAEFKYGAQLQTANLATSAVTGVKSSMTKFYSTISVGSSADGKTVVPVFGTTTAPTVGTITAFWIVGAGTAGSAVLWGTTAGTIAAFTYAATSGAFQGTAVLNAAIAAGDTVSVYNTNTGQGTCTYVVTFVTAN